MLEGTLVRRAAGRIKRGAARRAPARAWRLRQLRAAASAARPRVPGPRPRAAAGLRPPVLPGRLLRRVGAPLDAGRPVLYPPSWRSHGRLVIDEPARVAVLLHVHFPELVDELIEQLRHIPVPFDLIVTNSSGAELDIRAGPRLMRNCRVLPVQNHGRDIWPTVAAVNTGILDPYLLILKVHTKKSAWREEHAELAGDGADLAGRASSSSCSATGRTSSHILLRLPRGPGLGVVTADGSVLGPEFWGDNQRNARELARRLELRARRRLTAPSPPGRCTGAAASCCRACAR